MDLLNYTEFGGLGIAGLIIVLQYRFFSNHAKHLTNNIKENTAVTESLKDAVVQLTVWLKRREK